MRYKSFLFILPSKDDDKVPLLSLPTLILSFSYLKDMEGGHADLLAHALTLKNNFCYVWFSRENVCKVR
jgi:hypothetical protein